MKAVIKTGGKQYQVEEGRYVDVELLGEEADSKVVFDKVLMADGVTGNPYVKGVKVEGEVLKQGKGKTVLIIPGWATSIETYNPLIDSLSEYRTVYCLDMPGFGESEEPKESEDKTISSYNLDGLVGKYTNLKDVYK